MRNAYITVSARNSKHFSKSLEIFCKACVPRIRSPTTFQSSIVIPDNAKNLKHEDNNMGYTDQKTIKGHDDEKENETRIIRKTGSKDTVTNNIPIWDKSFKSLVKDYDFVDKRREEGKTELPPLPEEWEVTDITRNMKIAKN